MAHTLRVLIVFVVAVSACCCSQEPRYVVVNKASLFQLDAAYVTPDWHRGATVILRVVPTKGYHFNTDFPASARIRDAGALAVERREFAKGDFRVDGDDGLLEIPVANEQKTATQLCLLADFAICDEGGCIPFRKVDIEIPVAVQ